MSKRYLDMEDAEALRCEAWKPAPAPALQVRGYQVDGYSIDTALARGGGTLFRCFTYGGKGATDTASWWIEEND